MQYKTLALSALAATAFAEKIEKRQDQDIASIFQVLATALPSSLVAEALTNSAAVAQDISSQFAAGETPTWFTGLPSDIQTYLVPIVTGDSAAISSATAALSTASGPLASVTMSNLNSTITPAPTMMGNGTNIGNATEVSMSQSEILSEISSQASSVQSEAESDASSTTTTGSSEETSAAGAEESSTSTESDSGAMPTAMVGAGLAGAVGLAGLFAL